MSFVPFLRQTDASGGCQKQRKRKKTCLSENRKSRKYRVAKKNVVHSIALRPGFEVSADSQEQQDDLQATISRSSIGVQVQLRKSTTSCAIQCKYPFAVSRGQQTSGNLSYRSSHTQTQFMSNVRNFKCVGTQTILQTSTKETQSSHGTCIYTDDTGKLQAKNYDKIYKKLIETGCLSSLVEKLHEANQINAFINLIDTLSTGKLSATNLAWKSALYRAKWCTCKSTTGIKYDNEYCEFFGILQLIFGASVINLLRGPGHFGKVVERACKKGKFDPDDGKCNFAVPCPRTLSNMRTGYAKNLKCGIIPQSIDTLRELSAQGKQFVLSMDGKYVGEGCKGERDGDVDMWGMEGPPTLEESLQKKKFLLHQVLSLQDGESPEDKIQICNRLVIAITHMLRTLRARIRGEFFLRNKLLKLVENNPNKAFGYQQSISRIHVNSTDCENICKRATLVNMELMEIMAHCNGLKYLTPNGHACTLSSQPNLSILRPPSQLQGFIDVENPDNSIFCKQGSAEWFSLRRLSPITGSSLWRGLGFDTLHNMKEHIKEHVQGKLPPPVSETAAKAMQHGHDYEPHGVATLVSCVLPALKPRCHKFLEVGPLFIKGEVREMLIEVSGDGIIHCENRDCTYKTQMDQHGKIAVEIKSPFPSEAVPLEPYYVVPQRHVAQCLAEMVAFKCDELWLCCVTNKSVTVNRLNFDSNLWALLFAMVKEHYDKEDIKLPTRLPLQLRTARDAIKSYTYSHCNLIAEVPMITAFAGIPTEPLLELPYYANSTLITNYVDLEYVQHTSDVLASECNLLIEEGHRVLRQPAKEVCLVMACDKDRKHVESIPNSMPFAFAMKGKYMTNKHMRHIANTCLDVCKAEGINVLAETYDGQWYNYVMFASDGSPLTRLHLARQTWSRIGKLNKERCIQEMLECSRMRQCDIDAMSTTSRFNKGLLKLNNIHITRHQNQALSVVSGGGSLYPAGIIANCNFHADIDINDYIQPTKAGKRFVKQIGLMPEEENLLCLLDPEIVSMVQEQSAQDMQDNVSEDFLPDLQNPHQNMLSRILSSDSCNLLNEILHQLREYKMTKWEDSSVTDLYPGILCKADEIIAKMTIKEMMICAKVLETTTGRIWYTSKQRKQENANLLASAFKGISSQLDRERQSRQKGVVKPLRYLCKMEIQKDQFHPVVVQSAYANAVHSMRRKIWEDKCPNALQGYIPMNRPEYMPARYLRYYSYPEKSETRNQIEHRTLDYTHMLTNIRSHILRKGYDFCKPKVFQEIADERPDIISRALVYDLTDKQNAYSAMRLFGKPVEKEMRDRGYNVEADFVQIVRDWHRACDERSITADSRVLYMVKFLHYLIDDVHLDKFPFKHIGRYVKGVPYQTFDAICQNITCRIQLYELALKKMYSARAISTLPCESMFSDLVRFDREGNGYIKACNIGMILGRVVAVNYVKHKPQKTYYLMPTTKGTYPVHVLDWESDEEDEDGNLSNSFHYANHHFDKVQTNRNNHRKRRSDITTGIAPMRGVLGVRMYHRVNERLINPETRAGRPITNIKSLVKRK